MEISSKHEAKANGLKVFFTGDPCKRGHLCERYVSGGQCVECSSSNRKRWRKENPERTLELHRSWRIANPDRERESHTRSNRKWWGKTKDLQNQIRRELRLENPELYREQSRQAFAKAMRENPAKRRAICKRWRDDNPERMKEIRSRAEKKILEEQPYYNRIKAQKRRRSIRLNGGSYTSSDVTDILKKQRNKCAYCRKCIKRGFHIDHIVPVAKGGDSNRRNLQLLCEPCNHAKWCHDPIEFSRKLGRLL